MALDAMFKLGFLADVYSERPILPSSIRKVVIRFSLQPNGFLYLGHTKAIIFNFGFAYFYRRDCLLHFDNTKPS
jgi:glutaminyl-tRNA synthetase